MAMMTSRAASSRLLTTASEQGVKSEIGRANVRGEAAIRGLERYGLAGWTRADLQNAAGIAGT
jgi:hypothetical protein